MRALDEHGVGAPLQTFLDKVKHANGALHVSLDVDFWSRILPGSGHNCSRRCTFREAHLIMEILCDSGLVSSLDLVELNPFLDERGRTAKLMVDLVASLLGRKVLDRPTRSYEIFSGKSMIDLKTNPRLMHIPVLPFQIGYGSLCQRRKHDENSQHKRCCKNHR